MTSLPLCTFYPVGTSSTSGSIAISVPASKTPIIPPTPENATTALTSAVTTPVTAPATAAVEVTTPGNFYESGVNILLSLIFDFSVIEVYIYFIRVHFSFMLLLLTVQISVTENKSMLYVYSHFLSTIHENYLVQFVDKPTHFRPNQTPQIDLILANDPDFINNIEYHPPIGKSHHSVISFNIDIISYDETSNPVFKYLINKGDYVGMREFLRNVVWGDLLNEDQSIEQQSSIILNKINEAKKLFVPLRKVVNINRPKRTFTAPTSLLNLIHLKRSAFKQWKRCPSDENYKIYTKYRNKVKYESNNTKRVKEQFVAKSSKENPKYFYQYAKSKLKIKENISSLLKDDGTLTKGDLEKAEVLNNFFTSRYYYEHNDEAAKT